LEPLTWTWRRGPKGANKSGNRGEKRNRKSKGEGKRTLRICDMGKMKAVKWDTKEGYRVTEKPGGEGMDGGKGKIKHERREDITETDEHSKAEPGTKKR